MSSCMNQTLLRNYSIDLNTRMARCGLVLLASLTCAILPGVASAQEQTATSPAPPLARLDGQPIGETQLPEAERVQLSRMMQQVYGVQMRALHEVIDHRLIEAEAKKKGVSEEELFKTEVTSKVPDPTDDQLKANYESRNDLNTQPFDDVKDKIRKQLKEAEIQRARTQFVAALWLQAVNDGRLEVLLATPSLDLPIDPSRLRGDPKAPVTIVEFSDFSCPFCRKAEGILNEVMAKYPGKVKLSYRDFPLTELHPHAEVAAEASRCAGEQGKYWEYHDWLFANPDKQTHEALLAGAHALTLNDKEFTTCLDGGRFKAKIDQDIQLGSRMGVTSTPGFFVNGKFISGAQPATVFEKAIDKELADSASKPTGN